MFTPFLLWVVGGSVETHCATCLLHASSSDRELTTTPAEEALQALLEGLLVKIRVASRCFDCLLHGISIVQALGTLLSEQALQHCTPVHMLPLPFAHHAHYRMPRTAFDRCGGQGQNRRLGQQPTEWGNCSGVGSCLGRTAPYRVFSKQCSATPGTSRSAQEVLT